MQMPMDVVIMKQQKITLTYITQLLTSRLLRRLIHQLNQHQRFLLSESALKNAQVEMIKLQFNATNQHT